MSEVVEGTGPDALDRFAPELDALLDAAGAPVTATRPWLATWARVFDEWDPWVIGVRDVDGGLRGAALLARKRGRSGLRVVGMGHGASDRSRALVTRGEDAVAPLADAVASRLSALRGPWALVVEQLPADAPEAAALAGRLRTGVVVPGDGCPVLDIVVRDAATYINKKVRRELRTARQRLAGEGMAFTVESIRATDQVLGVLPLVLRMHEDRDHDVGRKSDLDDPRRRRFYVDVITSMARLGVACVTLVRIDGEPAGFDLSLVDDGAFRLFDGRIVTKFARFSPGYLAHEALLEQAVGDPSMTRLDWMRGEQPYKKHLARDIDSMVELRAWSSPAVRSVVELPRRARTWFRGVRQEHPQVQRLWGEIRRRTITRR